MKRIAVTFEHDHSDLTKVWQDYYSQYLDTRVVKIGDMLRHDWGATYPLLNSLQPELFTDYELILFADIDEIIVPKDKTLGEYLDEVNQDVVRCVGYNVIQMPDEPPIDLTKPILDQRKYWSRDEMYDKFVIITKPQTYTSNHHIINPVPADPNLTMLHLRDIDIDMARNRNNKVGVNFDEKHVNYRRSIAFEMPECYCGII
jgi:hypothetical protein